MLSSTNLPDLDTLLCKGTVRRPVNALFKRRDYMECELGTLKSLEPDVSKAVRRQLSDTERDVLLEYKSNSIASESRPSAFAVSIAALGGLLSTMCMTRVRRRWIGGRSVDQLQLRHPSLSDCVGSAWLLLQIALLLKPAESLGPCLGKQHQPLPDDLPEHSSGMILVIAVPSFFLLYFNVVKQNMSSSICNVGKSCVVFIDPTTSSPCF